MRHRGDIRNRAHSQAHGLDGTDGILAAGAGTFDEQFHFLNAQLLGGLDSLFGGQTGSKGRALAGALEASRTSAAPGNRVAFSIGHSDNRIIERSKDMHLPGGQGALALFWRPAARRAERTL